MEKSFIFFPSPNLERSPADAGLAFEDLFFTAADGVRLNGWFIPHPGAAATVVWFHGNAGNIAHRVENIGLLHRQVGVHIFIFDYRGYGRSHGEVSEQGTYRDGEGALEYLRSRKDVDPKKIVFFGRSLGAAVAAEMAIRRGCMALILETPFASIREMARVAFPFFPVGPFLKTRYAVLDKIKEVRAPLLVVHGDRDEIVPLAQARKVFAAAPEPKEFYTIRGARHNDTHIVGGEGYFAALRDFIRRAETRTNSGE
ncbi:MAG: alpha/beta hydrolase [Deltaproteobacteria bacterium]|nr:alpha/beta hydrolase [Deltaproteobacteria bacterium]